jgi:hypothetical protein
MIMAAGKVEEEEDDSHARRRRKTKQSWGTRSCS